MFVANRPPTHEERIFEKLSVHVLEGHDLGATFGMLAVSDHPFDRWFRDQVKSVHGIDFTKPMPGPLPEQVLAVNRD